MEGLTRKVVASSLAYFKITFSYIVVFMYIWIYYDMLSVHSSTNEINDLKCKVFNFLRSELAPVLSAGIADIHTIG